MLRKNRRQSRPFRTCCWLTPLSGLNGYLKMPIFGQMKVNHEYNSVYATTAGVRKLGDYMSGRGQVNRPVLEQDLNSKINDVREALRKFKR